MSMNRLSNAIIASLYSSFVGSLVVAMGVFFTILIKEYETTYLISAVGGALLYYGITVIASSLLAFFIGSPIYLLMLKINFTNYVTCAILGGMFISVIYRFNLSVYNFHWVLAGAVTGIVYHYVYVRNLKIKDI